MRRHAKASSAGSTLGAGNSRARFRRAFATRGASSDFDGSSAPSRSALAAIALMVCALAALLASPVAQAGKVPGFGFLGTGTSGALAGQLSTPKGLAVNRAGVGGASAGDVYVVDSGNNRISQFSGSGSFIRAFGQDVVTSGPDNVTPTSAVQSVEVPATVTAGTFTLGFNGATTGGTGTGTLTEGSSSITGLLTAKGTGNLKAGSFNVTAVATSVGKFLVGQPISGNGIPAGAKVTEINGSTLTLSAAVTAQGTGVEISSNGPIPFTVGEAISGTGIPAGTTITATGAGTLTLSAPVEAGNSASGVALTANLPYNASSSTVQAALTALASIGTGNAIVTGGPGATAPYTVTFAGALANSPIEPITANSAGLTGGSVAISTTTAGVSAYEICNVVANPSDVCKAGTASALAGSLNGIQGIAIDQSNGNLYVISSSNLRVDVFSATGKFEGAFGWNVKASMPAEELQFCNTATGCKAGVSGARAGQFAALANAMPAVDPSSGDLYVPQGTNKRVDRFAPALNGSKEVIGASFVRAFGYDVLPAIFEEQKVTLSGATGGTFKLSFESGTTGGAGIGQIEAGSNEISGVTVSSGAFVAGEIITAPGVPAGTTVTAVAFDSLTLSANATVSDSAAPLSTDLPFNATAALVQKALQALPGLVNTKNIINQTVENVHASGAAGGPWTVTFGGSSQFEVLNGVNVPPMTVDASGLTGTSPGGAIATLRDGANGNNIEFERCTVATTCKAGGEVFTEVAGALTINTTSVAVDSAGTVYLSSPKGAVKINSSGTVAEQFTPSLNLPTGNGIDVAVDPSNDRVIIARKISATEAKFVELSKNGTVLSTTPAGQAGLAVGAATTARGLAVGTGERIYFSNSPKVLILGVPPAPKAAIEPVSAIGGTTATFAGTATPSAPGIEGGFPTAYRFEYSTNGISWTSTEELPMGDGTGVGNPNSCPTANPPSCNLTQTVTGLQPGTDYLVRLVANNGTETTSAPQSFTTASSTPSISGLTAEPVSETAATIVASLNPNNRPTTYHFEWGTDTSYGTRIPLEYDTVVGSGGQTVKVTASLTDLQAATVYHFRVVATSSAGTVKSPDQEFVTLNAAGLPDNRQFELVSPADKRPNGFVGLINPTPTQFKAAAAEDGDAFAYPILNGLEDTTSGGATRYLAARSPSGWQSSEVSAPALASPPDSSEPSFVLGYSPTLKCGVLSTYVPLTDDTPAGDVELGIRNLYRWNRDGSYTLLSNLAPLNPGLKTLLASERYTDVYISLDCNRIYFRSEYIFSSGAGVNGLYEWDDGTLRSASKLPNGAVPVGSVAAGGHIPSAAEFTSMQYAMSRDGSRFFFTATSNQGKDSGKQAVFVRKDGGAEVVDASQPTTATLPQGARYEAAAADGSHVIFRSNYGIASTTSSGPTTANCINTASLTALENRACDLYDYNVETGELTDITADTNPADTNGATVEGLVDLSRDGSHVYFAAMGQLVPGQGKTYVQNIQGATVNVYLTYQGKFSYVATLSAADLKGGTAGVNGASRDTPSAMIRQNQGWSAHATPNGRYLLFSSNRNLTSYNSGGIIQAYRYSAETGETLCVTCRRDGLPPGPPAASSYKFGPVPANQTRSWAGHYVARAMSDDGSRIFFTTRDALAPGATSGKENVYEWRKGVIYFLVTAVGTASGLGEFLDSSTSGDDVFIATRSQLSPEDFDNASDVYNLRVDGGFPPPPTPPNPCLPAADQCQGIPTPVAPAPNPGSAGFSGPGNPPAQNPPVKKHRQKKGQKKKRHQKKKHSKQMQKRQHDRAINIDRGGVK